jgi:hypothetical protein
MSANRARLASVSPQLCAKAKTSEKQIANFLSTHLRFPPQA